MSVRLKNLTALTLAVLYGLVGLTGVSLHSLVEDFSLKDIYAQDLGSDGYFHIHQPDNHLHFHHPHQHGESQAESSIAAAVDEGNQSTTNLKRNDQFHSPHACPLLTLISQLKLGQGGWVAIRVESDAQHCLVVNLISATPLEWLLLSALADRLFQSNWRNLIRSCVPIAGVDSL